MKIVSCSINGFKNLNQVTLDFKHKLTAIIGLNNFGKSNLFEGLEFGLYFMRDFGEFKKKQELMSEFSNIPQHKHNLGSDFEFELVVLARVKDKEYFIKYHYKFKWKQFKDIDPQIYYETLHIKENVPNAKYKLIITRDNSAASFKESDTKIPLKAISIKDDELVLNKLSHLENYFYQDILATLGTVDIISLNVHRHQDKDHHNHNHPSYSKTLNHNPLANDLLFLKQNHPHKFKLINNLMSKLCPEIEYIKVEQLPTTNSNLTTTTLSIFREYFSFITVKFNYMETEIRFDDLSAGIKHIVFILTKIILSNLKTNPCLLLIDTLEHKIHPHVFARLLHYINNLLDHGSILVSSHSPQVINNINLDDVYIGYDSIKGLASFHSLNKRSLNKVVKMAFNKKVLYGNFLFDLLEDTADGIDESCNLIKELLLLSD